MSVVESPEERAWHEGEARTVALMGSINIAVARLVGTVRMLIDTDGWTGGGIHSVEHWLTWKAGVSQRRAGDLVRIARRIDELPACWGLFEAGRLTEDAMARIARRVPAARDAEVAGWAPAMMISQLTRALKSCPELPDPAGARPDTPPRQRHLRVGTDPDGWGRGSFSLPPDEMAQLQAGLDAARDAEFRDRQGLEPDADLGYGRGDVTWADALCRLAREGTDALDVTLARTGRRGERTKVVVHVDVDPDGNLGPGQLHLGAVIPDPVARFLRCDAEVMVAAYLGGRLIGINPGQRTVPRHVRRAIERRDQGCTHPLCQQTRWLHIHHLEYWEHGGRTIPANLICLCPRHHRQHHLGELRIDGDPEAGTLRFYDARGRPIEPPEGGSPRPLSPDEPSPFTPPTGEPLQAQWFTWN